MSDFIPSKDDKLDDETMALFKVAKEAMDEEDLKTAIINPRGLNDFFASYEKIKKSLKTGDGVSVTYELYKPYKCMGSITLSGKKITFKNMKLFREAVGLASNYEAYAKRDGTVEMNLTFHDLTLAIE